MSSSSSNSGAITRGTVETPRKIAPRKREPLTFCSGCGCPGDRHHVMWHDQARRLISRTCLDCECRGRYEMILWPSRQSRRQAAREKEMAA